MAELLQKLSIPIASIEQAHRNHAQVCGPRGHCGPFLNEFYYLAFPGWHGYGDCVHCGSTVFTAGHGGAEEPRTAEHAIELFTAGRLTTTPMLPCGSDPETYPA